MVAYGLGVVHGVFAIGLFPLVHVRRRDLLQFGNPPSDVRAVGVEPFLLEPRVEYAEVRLRVAPGGGGPLPVAVVHRGVKVGQVPRKVRFAFAPVDVEVFGEERRRHHAHAVMHVAGGEEFAHARVDNGEAGLSLAPRVERRRGARPLHRVIFFVKRVAEHVRKVKPDAGKEVAPQQFLDERVVAPERAPYGVERFARRDSAELVVRRQVRGGVERGQVALCDVVLLRGNPAQQFQAFRSAAREPRGCGFAQQLFCVVLPCMRKRVFRKRALGQFLRLADGQGEGVCRKRTVNRVRCAVFFQRLLGFVQQRVSRADECDASLFADVLQGFVTLAGKGRVVAVAVHGAYVLRAHELHHRLVGRALEHRERRAVFVQVAVEVLQRLRQKAQSGSASVRMVLQLPRVEDEAGDHRFSASKRVDEPGIVGQAQVAPEEEEDGAARHGLQCSTDAQNAYSRVR